MFGLPIAFAAPAALVALVGLVALYWLLRITPPRPHEEKFPPLRLLLGLTDKDTTPAKTPWPLLALRMFVAAAVVLAMAGPLWRVVQRATGDQGALIVLLDDGWAAAPTWERRIAAAREAARAATDAGRLVALEPLSAGAADIAALDAGSFAAKLTALDPKPYAPERADAAPAIGRFLAAHPRADILWIADGLELGGARAFAAALKALAHGSAIEIAADAATPLAVSGLDNDAGILQATLSRADTNAPDHGLLSARDAQGRRIAEASFAFGAGLTAKARFEIPVELGNQIARLAIADEPAAGATWLVDERWRRRRVAILSGASADVSEPLLSPVYYIERALQPFAEIRKAAPDAADPIGALIAERPSVVVLADMSIGPGAAHDELADFVDRGGLLIRFAGTRLAAGEDDLIPTALRRGGRTLGGALSWDTPKHIAPFEPPSPFVGLVAPAEVTVTRQVLAEPEPGLPDKTWARLADGTPLVTAARRGKGLIVLFHVTADTTWSNLPLSGLFVDMLKRIVERANAAPGATGATGAAGAAAATEPPYRTLDGYGTLGAPPADAEPIPAGFDAAASSSHPPGFYGAAQALTAVNALTEGERLVPADYAGLPRRAGGLASTPPIDLKPWLLTAAFLAFLADSLASLWLSRPRRVWRAAAALGLALVLAAPAPRADAGISDEAAALDTHLGYVITGDREVDETTRLGLVRLGETLARRTSAVLADPVGLDPARDELAFYPLIYWPVVASRPPPPPLAVARIAEYMKNGGIVVFDTRDALDSRPGGPPTPEAVWLRKLLSGVDVPELEPVPPDHVVTKTFYLLDRLVGRTDTGETWIEALPPLDPNDRVPRPARAGDSVSPIIITSNDLAGAWAVDDSGEPLHPLIPGGPRQRELALRSGVNLVMYALTGNYKADQVHAKDLLERLSH